MVQLTSIRLNNRWDRLKWWVLLFSNSKTCRWRLVTTSRDSSEKAACKIKQVIVNGGRHRFQILRERTSKFLLAHRNFLQIIHKLTNSKQRQLGLKFLKHRLLHQSSIQVLIFMAIWILQRSSQFHKRLARFLDHWHNNLHLKYCLGSSKLKLCSTRPKMRSEKAIWRMSPSQRIWASTCISSRCKLPSRDRKQWRRAKPMNNMLISQIKPSPRKESVVKGHTYLGHQILKKWKRPISTKASTIGKPF